MSERLNRGGIGFFIIRKMQGEVISKQMLFMKFMAEFVGHLDEDVTEFFEIKSSGKDLARADAVVFAAIGFYIGNRGRFNSPSVVDN